MEIFGLEIVEGLSMFYFQGLIFLTGIADTVRVGVNLSQVADYFLCSLERVRRIGIIAGEEVLL